MEARAISLRPLANPPSDSIERIILRRGSTRRFLRDPIGFDQLSTVLAAMHESIPCDFRVANRPINDAYLIVNAVDGLASGAYVFETQTQELLRLKAGRFRAQAAYLCLEQPLLGQAAAVVFLMADLGAVLEDLGARGYRVALLEAGILGGWLYLAAYRLKLGATGSTFYDDEVTEFFLPHARGKSPMLAIGIGKDARRFLPQPAGSG
jgi:SagB-type dehydrogenase family enzyme